MPTEYGVELKVYIGNDKLEALQAWANEMDTHLDYVLTFVLESKANEYIRKVTLRKHANQVMKTLLPDP